MFGPGYGHGFGVGRKRSRGTGVGAQGPASVPVTPTARWHPAFSSVATSGGRVTGASDLMNMAALTEGTSGAGPFALIDNAGRRFWRFEGSEYLTCGAGLVTSTRAVTLFMLARQHKGISTPFFSLGSVDAGTAATGGNILRTATVSSSAAYLYAASISASSDAAAKAHMIPGSQLQLIGVRSATTANGGTRLYVNGIAAAVAQVSTSASGIAGAEIGRYSASPGASGSWAKMDVYEILVYDRALTNAEADAVAAALISAWGIAPVTDTLVVEGDSITDGVGTIRSGASLGMMLSEPGGPASVAPGWRVINMGQSGNQVSNLVTRRDATNGMADVLTSGRNVMAVQIGRNNLGVGAMTGQQVYDAIVPLIRNGSTGYLDRGWSVLQAINIATSSSVATENGNLRTLLRASAFLTDCQAGAGQAHEGKLSRVDLPTWTYEGQTIFEDLADAANTIWFQGDSTHPTEAGTLEMAKAYRAALG